MSAKRELSIDPTYLCYALAISVVAEAFLLRNLGTALAGSELPPFITFYPAVMVAAVLCGLWPGLLATALGTMVSALWILPRTGQFRLARSSDGLALTIFCGMGVFMSLVAERYRGSLRRVAALETEQKLSEATVKLEAALASSADAVCISDADENLVHFNEAFATFHKFKDKAECAKTLGEYPAFLEVSLEDGEPAPLSMWAIPRALRGETVPSVEYTLRRKDSGESWIGAFSFSPIRNKTGAIIGSIVGARDVTKQKQVETSLRASEARYRTVFHDSLDCIAINRLDDGGYLDVNQSFLDIVGYTREEIVGQSSLEIGIWANPRERLTLVEALRLNSKIRDFETQFVRKNGELFWGRMSASTIEIDGIPCLLSMTRDLSSVKDAEEKIRSLAFFDPLTGLPNRRLLLERLRQPRADGAGLLRQRALLFIDLDHFKTLNDTLGHQIGDLLLQDVARRLSLCLPEANTVSRLGSDEFVVVLDDLSEVAAEASKHVRNAAEKILAAISEPYLLDGRECLSSCSIGITFIGSGWENTDDFLQQADLAMFQAKTAGRNTLRFFVPALQTAANARAALEEDLRQAIKKKQFLLYYQPQVNRSVLIGAEALVRWRHPKRGLMLPGEFIALAEETGLILPLGHWVLEAACTQVAAWEKMNPSAPVALAVNISARQFRQPEFVDQVLAILARTGASPQNIKLELTESMLVENIEEVIAKMADLKSHGLHFSLDDFGTGYSSLSYLKRLPLDQLKIDRAFVRDILVDASSGAIAQTIIALGRAMGLPVIAEGVETEEQREFLASLGCHTIQGYLFSRPVPLEDFQRLLRAGAN